MQSIQKNIHYIKNEQRYLNLNTLIANEKTYIQNTKEQHNPSRSSKGQTSVLVQKHRDLITLSKSKLVVRNGANEFWTK